MNVEQKKLVEDNFKLVYYSYNKLCQTISVQRNREDLISEGMFGLVKAAKSYIPSKATFATYAVPCIRNQMLQLIRRISKHSEVMSLDAFIPASEQPITYAEIVQDRVNYENHTIQKIIVEQVMKALRPRDRKALLLSQQGFKQKTIAKTLKISQGQVSRILRSIKSKLRG